MPRARPMSWAMRIDASGIADAVLLHEAMTGVYLLGFRHGQGQVQAKRHGRGQQLIDLDRMPLAVLARLLARRFSQRRPLPDYRHRGFALDRMFRPVVGHRRMAPDRRRLWGATCWVWATCPAQSAHRCAHAKWYAVMASLACSMRCLRHLFSYRVQGADQAHNPNTTNAATPSPTATEQPPSDNAARPCRYQPS